jgi:hypothetical protein
MVLDEQPVKEFYGTAKPTIEEMREKENIILGTLDFHSPLLKPDWRISLLAMLLVSHKLISPQMYLTN